MKPTLKAYYKLSKPRIVQMVLVTTAIGFLLGGRGDFNWSALLFTLLGTLLGAGGAAALNNFLERDLDASMVRTRKRALPSGQIDPSAALTYGVCCVLAGVALLVWKVNLLTGFLVLLSAFLYVLVYTPLKRVTWLNTSIGAIPGALPPMSGWTGASGELELGAWVMFAILFAWQHPHFYSIAWMYRDDYARAGFRMLSVEDPGGGRLVKHMIGYSLALIFIAALPTMIGMTGWVYLAGSLILGVLMLKGCMAFIHNRTLSQARQVLKLSVLYLPCLLVLIVSDGVL